MNHTFFSIFLLKKQNKSLLCNQGGVRIHMHFRNIKSIQTLLKHFMIIKEYYDIT